MKYSKTSKGYVIQSERSKGKFYVISLELTSCTCPAFKYFTKGLPCKHIQFIQKDINKVEVVKEENNKGYDIKDGDEAFAFVEKYGEKTLEYLKSIGEVTEKNGKLFRL